MGDASLTGVFQGVVREVGRLHRSMLCTARHFYGSSYGSLPLMRLMRWSAACFLC